MSTLRIRKAHAEDIPSLIRAKQYTISNSYRFLSPEEQERWCEVSASEKYFQSLLVRDDTLVMVAEEAGEILGLCAISRIAHGLDKWAEVSNLFSVGEMRGIGKAMLGASIAIAEGWGLRELRCPVFMEDQHSLGFFQRWDFYPSHHEEHQHLPGRSLLYLKRPLRGANRPKQTDDILSEKK